MHFADSFCATNRVIYLARYLPVKLQKLILFTTNRIETLFPSQTCIHQTIARLKLIAIIISSATDHRLQQLIYTYIDLI